MAEQSETRKIMTKPLPQILDEIEDSIGLADEAAKNARDAAEEARKAGEQAAENAVKFASQRITNIEEAIKVSDERITKVEKAINERITKIDEHITKVEQIAKNALQLAELLKSAVIDGVVAVDRRISEKAPDTKSAPKSK